MSNRADVAEFVFLIGWIAGAMLACCAGAWIVVYVATGMLAHR